MNKVIGGWASRVEKQKVREVIIHHAQTRLGVVKSYLFLPGWDNTINEAGQCFKLGVKRGLISPQTKALGFENESQPSVKVSKITQYFRDTYPAHDVTIIKDDVASAKLKPASLDFAFLDLCGNINPEMYRWLRDEFKPALVNNAVFAITLPFGRAVPAELYLPLRKRLTEGDLTSLMERFLDDYELWGDASKVHSNSWGEYSIIALGLFILKCIFRDYHLRLAVPVMTYCDGHIPMFVLVFDQIRPRINVPIYPDLLPKEPTMVSKASKAATQANATKRKQALASAAAKRIKRHNAAVKAWKTRRAAA